MARTEPWPQNGSTTTRVSVSSARKRQATLQAVSPMARGQGMKPASAKTSGPGRIGVGRGVRDTQSMWEYDERPWAMVPGGLRQTILCQTRWASAASAARCTR